MKNKLEQATVNELKNGFVYNTDVKTFTCLFCSAQYEDGDIYSFGSRLVCAEKAIKLHISEKHGDIFDNLLPMSGLTDTQNDFLKNYHAGLPDKEIAEKMDISASTVRYQRYNFREKAKQAKMILALYELLEEKPVKPAVENENEEKLEAFFESASPLVLKTFNVKEKNKLFILKTIVQQFEIGKKYSDKEVNAILKPIYDDYASIRRNLIDYGLMARTSDCREYWVIKE